MELKDWLAAKVVLPSQVRDEIAGNDYVVIVMGKVNVMRGSSQVDEMWGSSQVNVMRGSSQVNEMRDSSQVNEMRGSSQVNLMRGSSQATTHRPQIQTALVSKDSVVIDRSVSPPKCYVGKQK